MDTQTRQIQKYRNGKLTEQEDILAVEEPLEIRLSVGEGPTHACDSIAITMRTPGHDFELAAGFLLSEGIVKLCSEIANIDYCKHAKPGAKGNIVRVQLQENAVEGDVKQYARRAYISSSCGICGRASLDRVAVACGKLPTPSWNLSFSSLQKMLVHMNAQQKVFAQTGGLHASGIFSKNAECLVLREDVGRHNALDKAIGKLMLEDRLPLHDCVLLVSGRSSFELVQKAIIAGIPVLAAVGAPSSLAVELADRFGLCLIGFLSQTRLNVYTGRLL